MATNRAGSTNESAEPIHALLKEIRDTKARTLLRSWTDKYCELSDEIDERKVKQNKLKDEQIEPLREKLGIAKIETDEWFISRYPGKSSLNKEKLQRYLFQKGVPLALIQAAMEYATSQGKPYTEIKRRKQKADGEEQ